MSKAAQDAVEKLGGKVSIIAAASPEAEAKPAAKAEKAEPVDEAPAEEASDTESEE